MQGGGEDLILWPRPAPLPSLSAGTRSSAKKSMIRSIQHGSIVVTSEIPTPALILDFATNSTLINRGISSVDDDVNVAKESVCWFYPWPLEPLLHSERGP